MKFKVGSIYIIKEDYFRGYEYECLEVNVKHNYTVLRCVTPVNANPYVILTTELVTYKLKPRTVTVMMKIYPNTEKPQAYTYMPWESQYSLGLVSDTNRIIKYVEVEI